MPSRWVASLGLIHHQQGCQPVRTAQSAATQLPGLAECRPRGECMLVCRASHNKHKAKSHSRCRLAGASRNAVTPAPNCLCRSVMIRRCGCQPASRAYANPTPRRPPGDAASRADSHRPADADLSSSKRLVSRPGTYASSAPAACRLTGARPCRSGRQRGERTLTGAGPSAGIAGS